MPWEEQLSTERWEVQGETGVGTFLNPTVFSKERGRGMIRLV